MFHKERKWGNDRTRGVAACFLTAGIFFGVFSRTPACAASGGEGLEDVAPGDAALPAAEAAPVVLFTSGLFWTAAVIAAAAAAVRIRRFNRKKMAAPSGPSEGGEPDGP